MLDSLFAPRGVAVLGASLDERKLGYAVARNLVHSRYRGALCFIHPRAARILGVPCYPTLAAAPDPIDLAVIIVPSENVPALLEQCGQRGIPWAIVMSGGFRETDRAGAEREQQLIEIAQRYQLRLVGPNCIGVIDTHTPLNTTFLQSAPQPGEIAFISQSGALCQVAVEVGSRQGLGFSRLVSLGNQADLSEAEVVTALADDPDTRAMTLYLEGVQDGRRFQQAALLASRQKPLVILKGGRTAAGTRAASSHTGALAGQDAVYQAVFDRCGVVRADHLDELFDWARALAWCPPLRGQRVAVLTNAGGPGILAADALEANDLQLAALSDQSIGELRAALPLPASLHNPIDMLASAGPREYAEALRIVLNDDGVDAILIVNVPPPLGEARPIADAIAALGQGARAPIVTVLMGDAMGSDAAQALRLAQLPDYRFPDQAAAALGALRRRAQWLAQPLDKPVVFSDVDHTAAAASTGKYARGEGWLTGAAAAAVLAAYGINGPREAVASTIAQAVRAADQTGYPVVLKIVSPDIVHKSEVGGVAVNITTAAALRRACRSLSANVRRLRPEAKLQGWLVQQQIGGGQEVIVGMVRDAQFGPLLMCGAGGVEVEGRRDVAFALAPLSRADAGALLDSTFAGRKLRGFRGSPAADREAVIDRLLRLAQLAIDFPQIAEMEVNPLRVLDEGQGAVALDARVRLSAHEERTSIKAGP
jgi:acetyltransferase